MEVTPKPVRTYTDYAALPEGAPCQLIDGELVMSPSPNPDHQRVSQRLEHAIQEYLRSNRIGEFFHAPLDVYLSDQETYQPNILVVLNERRSIVTESKIEGAPDVVVEILSPSTGYYDLTHKKDAYAVAGVQEYWIVDPMEKWIEVFENSGGEFRLMDRQRRKGTIKSKLLPDFSVELESIL